MGINRREFVALTCVLAAGCAADGGGGNAAPPALSGPIDTGPASDYAADGVYDRFRSAGFFIVRQGPKLFAISSICTHRHCPLKPQTDHSFYCKCHGSAFTPDGHVSEGPATRDLAVYKTSVDPNGHLIVQG